MTEDIYKWTPGQHDFCGTCSNHHWIVGDSKAHCKMLKRRIVRRDHRSCYGYKDMSLRTKENNGASNKQ